MGPVRNGSSISDEWISSNALGVVVQPTEHKGAPSKWPDGDMGYSRPKIVIDRFKPTQLIYSE